MTGMKSIFTAGHTDINDGQLEELFSHHMFGDMFTFHFEFHVVTKKNTLLFTSIKNNKTSLG